MAQPLRGAAGERDGFAPQGEGVADGAFFAPTLLLARDPASSDAHHLEAFGPVRRC
jgi:oxepin-CoA hydrolase/3-oxo-5,6-dehydrosuberyl-CoA semialdehyde dehydrogenase